MHGCGKTFILPVSLSMNRRKNTRRLIIRLENFVKMVQSLSWWELFGCQLVTWLYLNYKLRWLCFSSNIAQLQLPSTIAWRHFEWCIIYCKSFWYSVFECTWHWWFCCWSYTSLHSHRFLLQSLSNQIL